MSTRSVALADFIEHWADCVAAQARYEAEQRYTVGLRRVARALRDTGDVGKTLRLIPPMLADELDWEIRRGIRKGLLMIEGAQDAGLDEWLDRIHDSVEALRSEVAGMRMQMRPAVIELPDQREVPDE